jgi:hypothetical protein
VKRGALIAAVFAALTVAMAAPWSLHPASRVLVDAPDTHLFIWTLGWDARAFLTNPFGIFNANIYHPLPNTLAYSENLIGTALIAAPVIWLTGDAMLAMNLAALASCWLCGLGAYLLARKLRIGVPGAVIAGIVFAFAPARFFRMSQMHLVAMQWIPFSLAYLHSYFDTRRARDLRLAIGFGVLQVLCSGHGAVFLAVAAAAVVASRFALGEPLALRNRIRDLGLTGVLLLAPMLWIAWPYRRVQQEMGLRRTLENWTVTSASYLASPSHVHQWAMSWFSDVKFHELASAYLFPGILPVVLAVIALLRPRDARVSRRELVLYGAIAAVSVLLFIDGPLALWPWVYWWPGMNFIRAPSRFMILTTLCLAVLAGAGFEQIAGRWKTATQWAATMTVALLLLVEFSAYPFSGTTYSAQPPAADRWLATQPAPFVVAEVPLPDPRNSGRFERFQTMAMLHSMAHWQKTVHGYSGFRAPFHDQLYLEMRRFPDAASITRLREAGVNYVVVHRGLYPPEQWADVDARLAQSAGIRLVHEADGDRVYGIQPEQETKK